jgi:methionine sulfoxide reductase heme-binding subunit
MTGSGIRATDAAATVDRSVPGNATAGVSRAAPRGRQRSPFLHPLAKPLLFALCLLPFAWLLFGALTNALGANPAEKLIRATGDWTLRFVCITLSVTPVRRWLAMPALARFRRMLGLFTFFYGCLHFVCYAGLDQGLVAADILRDIAKRPFILVGTSALVLMTPLALTSFNRAIKSLGAARWQRLHRAVYAVALLGLLHFFWMRSAKHNYAEVAVYAAVIALLLGTRIVWAVRSGSRVDGRR